MKISFYKPSMPRVVSGGVLGWATVRYGGQTGERRPKRRFRTFREKICELWLLQRGSRQVDTRGSAVVRHLVDSRLERRTRMRAVLDLQIES